MKKIFLPFIIAVCFGGVFVAGRYLADTISPLQMSWLRYCFATALFVPIIWIKRAELYRLSWRTLAGISLGALLSTVLYHLLFYAALHYSSATNIALIHAINPLLTLGLSAVLLGERATVRSIGGFVLAAVGVVLVVSHGSIATLTSLQINYGELLMLIATTVVALYAILTKYLAPRVSAPLYTALIFLFGWIMLTALLPIEYDNFVFHQLSLNSWLAIAYMGIGSSGIGYYLYVTSTRTVGPSLTALGVYSFVPVVVAVLEMVVLQTNLSWPQFLGFGLIVTGMIIALLKKIQPRAILKP